MWGRPCTPLPGLPGGAAGTRKVLPRVRSPGGAGGGSARRGRAGGNRTRPRALGRAPPADGPVLRSRRLDRAVAPPRRRRLRRGDLARITRQRLRWSRGSVATSPRLLGDGLLVYFGYPHAHEDSAEQAVRAALDIVGAVAGLGRGLVVRVGLHSGPCVIERGSGPGGRRETLALGETRTWPPACRRRRRRTPSSSACATHRLVAGRLRRRGRGHPYAEGPGANR